MIKRTVFLNTSKIVLAASALFLVVSIVTPHIANAQSPVASSCAVDAEKYGIPTWYKYLPGEKDPDTGKCLPFFKTSFDKGEKLPALAGIGLAVIEILLRIAAVVAIAYVTYGGFMYLTSQGEPDRVKSAKDSIFNALIGLMIAMIATVLVNFIGNSLG